LFEGVFEWKLVNIHAKFPNFKRYFSMKLQVLFGVYACALPFHLQAQAEPSGDVPRGGRPMLEKRNEQGRGESGRGERGWGEERRKNSEGKGEMRSHAGKGEGHGKGDMFSKMDQNGDGVITADEFFASPRMERLPQEQRDKLFARIDLDGDGKVTPEEIRQMRRETHERQIREFRALDTDNSGGLSYEEFSLGKFFSKLPEEKRKQIFIRMDTNGDGEITPEDRPEGPRSHFHGKRDEKKPGDGKRSWKDDNSEAPGVVE